MPFRDDNGTGRSAGRIVAGDNEAPSSKNSSS